MKFPVLTPETCGSLARAEFDKQGGYKNKTIEALDQEICQSLLGTSYVVCSELWNLIDPDQKEYLKNAHPRHLFWALLFLKTYCTEPVLRRVVGGVDAGTYRNWSKKFIKEIAGLKPKVIIFKDRYLGWNGKNLCLISVDGIDCAVNEPYPFSKGIYSEKLNGPGLKYEIGVCIATGHLVWVNGPFDAGTHDIKIFKSHGLKAALCDDECVKVDSGYQGDEKFKNPKISQSRKDRMEKSKVRARHENVNSRLKQFSVLNDVFRHRVKMREQHKICFEAVAVITQLGFTFESPMYSVEYNAEYN